jgi:hypothetical protein
VSVSRFSISPSFFSQSSQEIGSCANWLGSLAVQAAPEQFIQRLAKVCLDDRELALGDRNEAGTFNGLVLAAP